MVPTPDTVTGKQISGPPSGIAPPVELVNVCAFEVPFHSRQTTSIKRIKFTTIYTDFDP